MKIGDTVYTFSRNKRVYVHQDGTRSKGPIFREHFTKCVISGETSRSWLITDPRYPDFAPVKAPKKSPFPAIYTLKQLEQACWVDEHGPRIRQRVASCQDYSKLQKIEAILNES